MIFKTVARTWIFLSSLQEAFSAPFKEYPKTHVPIRLVVIIGRLAILDHAVHLCSVSQAINASSTADRMISGA